MKKYYNLFSLLLALISFSFLPSCDNQNTTIHVNPEKKAPIDNTLQEQYADTGIRMGIGSIITPKEGYIYYRRLVEYLENKLEMPITVIDRGTYQEFNNLLAAGELDIAFVCGGPYVEGKEAFGLELLVVPETLTGETVYYADLIVPFDSPAQKLEDLEGKRFAFTDPQSNTGKLVPTYLLAKQGKTPEIFFDEIIYTYAHDKSIQAVAEKVVDAASVDSLIYEYLLRKNPELVAKTRILSKSEPFGIPPVAVSPNISDELRQQLRTILLQIDEDPEGRDILQGMQIKRFVESDDSAYDTIREIREFIRKHSQK